MHGVGHIVAGIATEATHLLREESSSNKIVHKTYITYTPLSEKAADLYLKTPEYQNYLGQRICHDLFYRGLDGKFHPAKSSKTGKFLTPKQAMTLKNRCKKIFPQKDKVTLMTKGIHALPKPKPFREESKIKHKLRYGLLCGFCFWNPMMWELIGKLKKNHDLSKNQSLNLVKSFEVHTDINLKI